MSPKLKSPIKKIFSSVFFIADSCSGSNSDCLIHWSVTSPAFSNTSARLYKTADIHMQTQHIRMINSQLRSQISKLPVISKQTVVNGTEPMKAILYMPVWPRPWSHLSCGPMVISLVPPQDTINCSFVPVPDPCYSSACLAAKSVFAEFVLIWAYFTWPASQPCGDKLFLFLLLLPLC